MMKKLLILILLFGFKSNSQTKVDTTDLKYERICFAFDSDKKDSIKFINERFFQNGILKSINYDFSGNKILENIKGNISINEVPFYKYDYKTIFSKTTLSSDIHYIRRAYFDKFGFPDSIQVTEKYWKHFKKKVSKKGKIYEFENNEFKYIYKYNLFGKLKSVSTNSNDNIKYVFKKDKLISKTYNNKRRICTYDKNGNLIIDSNDFERKLFKRKFNSSDNVIEMLEYDLKNNSSEFFMRTLYYYDNKDRLVKEMFFDKEGKLELTFKYFYN